MSHNISEKMLGLTKRNSAVREMFEAGNKLAEQFGRENVYDFSLGNPFFPAPESVNSAICEVLENTSSADVHGYMNNAGYPDVRKAVADSLNHRFETNFNSNNIIMTVGAAGGLNVIFKTLLNPDDEVIAISPYFLEYGNYVANYDSKLVVCPADSETFQPDTEALRNAITEKTKVLIINSPNNPTGVIYSAESIRKIATVLEEKSKEIGHAIYIVSDEPYRELAYDGVDVPWLTKFYPNTIVAYSWSKSLSLPGERIGYLVIPSEAEDSELIFTAASIANRILGFVNAPSLMQKAVAKCLNESTDIAAYDNNRKLLYEGLKDIGFDCIYPKGAFYMWVKTPIDDDKEFCVRAKKYNILVVPGSSFACSGYVRIAYCVSPDMIKKSIPSFKKLAEEFGL